MKTHRTDQWLRFETASRLLQSHKHHRMLDWPLSRWLGSDHLYTPAGWLDQTLREILQMPFVEIAGARGIGQKKLEKLLVAIDRARDAIERTGPVGCTIDDAEGEDVRDVTDFPYRVARDAHFRGATEACIWELDDPAWESVARLIQHHYLADFMLGRFCSSLQELHRSLWQVRISTLTRQPFSRLVRLQGFGDVKLHQSVSQILSLAFLLNALPVSNHELRISLLPAAITAANRWLTEWCLGEQEALPDVHAIRIDFLDPLLVQLEKDTNARLGIVARRRIGEGDRQPTLREIGNDFAVTPDRIRTLIHQAALVFRIRWPEGRGLLQGACAELSTRTGASAQRQLLQRIHQVFFGAYQRPSAQPPG
jgi:hypothetical protein